MKYLNLFAIASFIVTCFFSCKKTNEGTQPAKTDFKGAVPIGGKWSIQRDSVFTAVGAYGTGKTYTGKTGDYFNFGADDKLYIKEGANLDTFTYKILTDSTLSLLPVGATANYIPLAAFIKPTTATSVVLYWTPSLGNPGSFYSRTVSLDK